jgi:hypothetical protein
MRKVIIACPKFIQSVYEAEHLKVFGTKLPKNVEVVTYGQLVQNVVEKKDYLKGVILILDEAHYLIDAFDAKSDLNESEKVLIYTLMRSSTFKCLALTGTPFSSSIFDINILINVCAGKTIIPLDKVKFLEEFTTAKWFNTAFYGYFIPALVKLNNSQLLNVAISSALGSRAASALKRAFPTSYGPFTESVFTGFFGVSIIVSVAVLSVIRSQYVGGDLDPFIYRNVNYSRFIEAASPYISSFSLTPGTNGIPTSKMEVIPIQYSTEQFKLWVRLVYNSLTKADSKNLGIFSFSSIHVVEEDESDVPLSNINFPVYRDIGRMVSNVADASSYPEKFVKCFERIATDMKSRKGRYVVYSEFDHAIRSFIDFLKFQQKTFDFSFAHIRISDSPKRMGELLTDYNSGKTDILLLDPKMYEGINLFATSQMHILDPPISYKNLLQLKGRVVRVKSHESLPEDQRHVDYFLYVGILALTDINSVDINLKEASAQVRNKLLWFPEMLKLWKSTKTYKQKLFTAYNPTIAETATAEADAYKTIKNLEELTNDINANLRIGVGTETDIESRMTCCPTYIKDGADKKCLETLKLKPCEKF